jgi:nucleoside-diphosphate-sugar epimerase
LRLDPEAYRQLCRKSWSETAGVANRAGASKDLQVHHIQPRSRLGDDAAENLARDDRHRSSGCNHTSGGPRRRPPSIEQPVLYEQVNLAGTVNLLELCREFQVSRLVFGSSSSVYGASSHAPFSEEQSDLRPISPYAATKLAGELFCYTYAHLYQLPVICLRFFTVYGPRQRPDLAIHKFVGRIERGEPIPIFGDGETGRDYTYVDDIVAGVMKSLEYKFSPRHQRSVRNLQSWQLSPGETQ